MEHKSLPLSNCEIKLDGDTGRFCGYASIFGGVDSYGDTIVKGAYEYTLRKNGKPKMFYGHEAWKMPIGKWLKLSEDDTGLYVEGELTLGMSTANDVHAALKHGTLDGMSIGYVLTPRDTVIFTWAQDLDDDHISDRNYTWVRDLHSFIATITYKQVDKEWQVKIKAKDFDF